ncbi:hypothetical protein V1525DRAFT_173970 [Lipomyces kononenkoae]|uniref:Uncharacterized protein n=1 Tax=Lipomyces kononenkoae TaxID=34357 RepID=A0ACC3T282_LIPKO
MPRMSGDDVNNEIARLRKRIAELEDDIAERDKTSKGDIAVPELDLEEYVRYGRQMLVPEVGKRGQIALKQTKVLVVGAGGLGCPALLYLSGAGFGTIGIVDHDTVSLSNLPRQTLYSTASIGKLKVDAAVDELRSRNANVKYVSHPVAVRHDNIFEIVRHYDIVLDCTDTPMTRYLLGDATRLLSKPLVSASALRTEAQLVVLNMGAEGPCYRCVFPDPPEHVQACSDAGIIGPVVAVAGVLQSLEAIKLASGHNGGQPPTMTFFSAIHGRPWRCVRIRGRQKSCSVCGDAPTVSESDITTGKYDYADFCGGSLDSNQYPDIDSRHSISVMELQVRIKSPHVLLDVRDRTQYGVCSLPGSINLPLSDMLGCPEGGALPLSSVLDRVQSALVPLFVICRFGNDSRTAVQLLRTRYRLANAFDVTGGLNMWSEHVDRTFPRY